MIFRDSNLHSQGAKKLVEQSYNNLVDMGSLAGGSQLEWLDFRSMGLLTYESRPKSSRPASFRTSIPSKDISQLGMLVQLGHRSCMLLSGLSRSR